MNKTCKSMFRQVSRTLAEPAVGIIIALLYLHWRQIELTLHFLAAVVVVVIFVVFVVVDDDDDEAKTT